MIHHTANPDPSIPAISLLLLSAMAIVLSLPLILRLVKMNRVYGVRIPESFRSDERWYELNRFGGVLMLILGIILGVTGVIGLKIDSNQGLIFYFVSIGVVLGGAVLVTAAIFIYAAITKKKRGPPERSCDPCELR